MLSLVFNSFSPLLLAGSIQLSGGDLPAQLLRFGLFSGNLLEMFERAEKLPVRVQLAGSPTRTNAFCHKLELTYVNARETSSGCCEAWQEMEQSTRTTGAQHTKHKKILLIS
ncbi:hypothetical protein GOODEAATRI_024361 [Goodea atripinnis]|uniref:Uncharacterized protein n=1 Tax=Goodea atripinnis TaxID=208336 RepID=A0ABV0MV00_9TELE